MASFLRSNLLRIALTDFVFLKEPILRNYRVLLQIIASCLSLQHCCINNCVMIQITNVFKSFKGSPAVQGLNLSVEKSEILGRMKGLTWIEGVESQYLIQSVGNRLDNAKKRPWKAGEKKKSILVFIGKNLKREGIEKLLKRCFSK